MKYIIARCAVIRVIRRAFREDCLMSTAVAVNDPATGKSLSKPVGIAMALFALIEAVITYFLVIGPLYVTPVFRQAEEYNAQGKSCIVKLFGKTFASQAEIDNNQIILTFWDTLVNIVLVYLIITGVLLVLSFCFFKGFAFAKTYLIGVFGGKAVIGLIPIMIPFGNLYFRNTIKIFGAVDAVVCIAACLYFVYLSSIEYADDMLFSPEDIANMKKRGIRGGIMFVLLAASAILASFAVGTKVLGSWSLYLGWLSDTDIGQGVVLLMLIAVGMIAAITYVRDGDWALFFFASFGAAIAVSALLAVVLKLIESRSFGKTSIFFAASAVAALVLTIYSLAGLKGKISLKYSADEKKPALAVLISAGSILLSFALTIAAVTMWDGILYNGSAFGAMDYMYFIVYGGITLFLACAMMGGYDFTKFGTLALYLIVASSNFSSVFSVFAARSAAVAGYAAQGVKFNGYNYIITGVLFILAFLSCLGIIAVFVVKEVNNYMYQKRYC